MRSFIFSYLIVISNFVFGQTIQSTAISLKMEFNKAVEISSIAYVGDSIYMPASKCGQVFIGKIQKDVLNFRTTYIKKRNYEGLAYFNECFYFSDDSNPKIYKYNKTFDKQLDSYLIITRPGDETINGNNGFEGISVLNDSVFYILLEKDLNNHYSVLFKGILKNRQIKIVEKKYLLVDNKSRYCDLFYQDDYLYLLKTSFYGSKKKPFNENNCNTNNQCEIRFLKLDNNLNIEKNDSILNPDVKMSLSQSVREKCNSFNTNIEGFTIDSSGVIYIVSDNFYGNATCDEEGQKKTLLMRARIEH